jgi:hypothetical protein
MRVEALRRRIVIMRQRDIVGIFNCVMMSCDTVVVMRVGRRKRDLVRMHLPGSGVGMRVVGHGPDFDLGMVPVIEHRPGKSIGRVLDLEDMLKAIEHNHRHLDGQR